MTDLITNISAIATTLGVYIAAYQLYSSRKQATVTFEDSFSKEYRELANKIPSKAFLCGDDGDLTEDEYQNCFDALCRYFDLCNEQAYLTDQGRITEKTWLFWADGINNNMKKKAFKKAWAEIRKKRKGDFDELQSKLNQQKMSNNAQ